jgi:hypothetical protein
MANMATVPVVPDLRVSFAVPTKHKVQRAQHNEDV